MTIYDRGREGVKNHQNRQQNKNQIGEGCNMLGGAEHCGSQNNGLNTIRVSMNVFSLPGVACNTRQKEEQEQSISKKLRSQFSLKYIFSKQPASPINALRARGGLAALAEDGHLSRVTIAGRSGNIRVQMAHEYSERPLLRR